MASKTVSLHTDAYDHLKAARRHPGESFSQVVLRARWPDAPMTAGQYLRYLEERGPLFAEADLDAIDEIKKADAPPRDKWTE